MFVRICGGVVFLAGLITLAIGRFDKSDAYALPGLFAMALGIMIAAPRRYRIAYGIGTIADLIVLVSLNLFTDLDKFWAGIIGFATMWTVAQFVLWYNKPRPISLDDCEQLPEREPVEQP